MDEVPWWRRGDQVDDQPGGPPNPVGRTDVAPYPPPGRPPSSERPIDPKPSRPDEPRRGPWRRLFRTAVLLVIAAVLVAGVLALVDARQQAKRDAEWQTQDAAAALAKVVRGPLTPDEVTALGKKVVPAIADVETEIEHLGATGAGTGILLTPNGDVLTNNHVINGATDIHVVLAGTGKRYPATVVGYDRTHDIAVVRLSGASRLKTAAIGDSSTVAIGEPIMGIGHEGGGGKTGNAPGTVTSIGESIIASDALTGSTERLQGLIKVAADIKPGYSGGPLVNADGEVVGVNTAASVNYRYKTPTGSGFAIPINEVMRVVKQIQGGVPSDTVHLGPTGILGVVVTGRAIIPGVPGVPNAPGTPGTPGSAGDVNGGQLSQPGARVAVVGFGSPAEDAGLTTGDLIVSLDGSPVDGPTALTALIGRRKPGDRVTLEWLDRTGQRRSGAATLIEGPPA